MDASVLALAVLMLGTSGASHQDLDPSPVFVSPEAQAFGAVAEGATAPVDGSTENLAATDAALGDGPAAVALPPCAEGMAMGECTPVTQCVPDAESPTGYTGFFIWGYDGMNGDFELTGPCEPSEAEQTARPSLPALVLRAFQRVPLPEPQISIQPPKGKTLVGLETIFSTKAEPFTRTLTLLGRQVQLKIEPSSFTWLHGDDTTQSTDWPGKPWNSNQPDIDGYITHRYEHTGTVRPGVEVTWSAQYRVGNGPWQDVNGTVSRTSPRAELQIVEGEPVLHGY